MPGLLRKQTRVTYLREVLEAKRLQRLIFSAVEEEDELDKYINDHVEDCLYAAYEEAEYKRYLFRRSKYRKGNCEERFEADLVFDFHDEEFGVNNDVGSREEGAWLRGAEFLCKYRMKRSSFAKVLELIQDHDIFKSTRRPQAPVSYQLMTWLKHVGTEGAGGSNTNQRETFGIGYGTADLYCCRVNIASCSLAEHFYKWPDKEERQKIGSDIFKEYNLPHCVGIADGTLFPLAFQPETVDAPDYSGRKLL